MLREFAKNPDFPLDKYHPICYPTIRIFKQVQRYRQDFLYGACRKVFCGFVLCGMILPGKIFFIAKSEDIKGFS